MPVLYQLSFTGFKGTEKLLLPTLSLLITIKKKTFKKTTVLSKRHLSAWVAGCKEGFGPEWETVALHLLLL